MRILKVEMGCSRLVILFKDYAIKFPNIKYKYPAILWGLLHNRSEYNWWKAVDIDKETLNSLGNIKKLLCPVIMGSKLGLFIVMRRAKPLPREFDCPVVFEWLAYRFEKADISCLAEKKIDSFGLLDDNIVAIDYA